MEEEFIKIGDTLVVGDGDGEVVGRVAGILTWATTGWRWGSLPGAVSNSFTTATWKCLLDPGMCKTGALEIRLEWRHHLKIHQWNTHDS